MKLIVGLGNPGEKYTNTRHNVGKMFVEVAKILVGDGVLVKQSDTFMNDSGKAVRKLVDFYKVNLGDLYVAHDDLDIPLGEYKIQKGTGPKVHNGVNDVEKVLGDKDFWRIRIGVDGRNGDRSLSGEDYVLGSFEKNEREILDKVFDDLARELSLQLK